MISDMSPRGVCMAEPAIDNIALLPPSEWFTRTKSAFQSSATPPVASVLAHRPVQLATLEHFWTQAVQARTPSPSTGRRVYKSAAVPPAVAANGALYISGPPGTGKSAFVDAFVATKAHQTASTGVRLVQLNCMAMSDEKKAARSIYDQCVARHAGRPLADAAVLAHLGDVFVARPPSRRRTVFVVVLDEVDRLFARAGSVVERLFEWSQARDSRLVFIGIANAMGLLERWVPRLEAHHIRTPLRCHFAPYPVDATVQILYEKACNALGRPKAAAGPPPGFHPLAIELCARKAAATGDLRKAIDLCRLALDLAEADYYAALAQGGANKENRDVGAATVQPLVGLGHVHKAIAAAFGSPVTVAIQELNLHHQLILIALSLLRADGCEATLERALEKYVALCLAPDLRLPPLNRTELQDSLTLIEGKGLVGLDTPVLRGKRNTQLRPPQRIILRISDDDLRSGIEAVSFLVPLLAAQP